MNTSPTITKITAAIAAVQAAIEPFTKNKAVKVEGDRAQWSSTYATLSQLDDAIREHVKTQGIAIIQTTEAIAQLGPVLVTRAALADEWIEIAFPIKASRDGAQGFGGGITFAKRWSTCALFNLIPDDAEEGQGYKEAKREAKAPRKAAAPGGLAAMLDAIRDSQGAHAFEGAARAARAAHPTGEPATAVERAIAARLIASIDGADSADKLTLCNDLHQRIQARGTDVRDAFRRAEQRLGIGGGR